MTTSTKIRTVLIDISGTLSVGGTAVNGATKAVERLLDAGLTIRYVTNTTTHSRSALMKELQDTGFPNVTTKSVFSSPIAAREIIQAKKCRPMFFIDPLLEEDFAGIERSEPNAVVVGLAPDSFRYDKMNEAFRILLGGGTLIAIHKGRYFAEADGLSLGPGPFVKALEYASGVEALVAGKPNASFFQAAIDSTGASCAEAIMIGDDVESDVMAAMKMGMKAILVQTGKYRSGDERRGGDLTICSQPSIVEAVDWILERA